MADSVKKASTSRKPRKAVAAKAAPEKAVAAKPTVKPKKKAPAKVTSIRKAATHEEIALLAHRFWIERGCTHGHDEEDWLRAEQTLLGKAS